MIPDESLRSIWTPWRLLDKLLVEKQIDVEEARKQAGEAGLLRRATEELIASARGRSLWIIEPSRNRLVPGPILLLDLGGLHGTPMLFRPVRNLLREDTGAFSLDPGVDLNADDGVISVEELARSVGFEHLLRDHSAPDENEDDEQADDNEQADEDKERGRRAAVGFRSRASSCRCGWAAPTTKSKGSANAIC